MDHPIIEYFTLHTIQGRDRYRPPSPPDVSSRSSPDIPSAFNANLFPLMHRVTALHFHSRQEPTISSSTICEAVELWSQLDGLTLPDEDLPAPEYQTLHQLHVSALFIWLHCITHPDNIANQKVQDMLADGLARMATLDCSSPDAASLLVIPLFLHGVASVRSPHRDAINQYFTRLDNTMSNPTLQTYQTIVQWIWSRHDSRIHRSWDWTDWEDAGLTWRGPD
ncbi:hypothetical protein BDW42DRAFT_172963 [Aspergillus taichungensis]|uniref:Fungal-specific transcription factor domain-domain-containing protein n=1 Tax=Aspergillus taichungensis TaxID=482145 RepID=A0A2J5HQC5_9EURO|nr:hypothetical protein BDW42DRAFT_172963 [Aspergillus taichungensis]